MLISRIPSYRYMLTTITLFLLGVGCTNTITEPIRTQEFLIIIEANTAWIGKIDTVLVSGTMTTSPKWYKINRPGVCWEIHKTTEVGNLRAYGTTPDFSYGYLIEKFTRWGMQDTNSPYAVVRGCIPEDARY